MCFEKTKLGNMFKRATNKNAKFAIIIGEDEIQKDSVIVKDLAKQEQQTVETEKLIDYIDARFKEEETQE